jgi:hypothetical protein
VLEFGAPKVQEPADGAELQGKQRFVWRWSHPALTGDYYFDLRIWHEDDNGEPEESRLGAITLTKVLEAEVTLAGAPAIGKKGDGVYYWSVVVVHKPCSDDTCRAEIVGDWAAARKFKYTTSGGKDNGGGDNPPPDGP